MAGAFAREKYNMSVHLVLSAGRPSAGGAFFVLDRLALGANVRHHALDLPHPHPVGDLDLDLIVVHHLGDLSDQPPEVITVSPRRKFFTMS